MRISSLTMQNQTMNALTKTQSAAGRTFIEMATGKRILSPSDDPIAYSRINTLNDYINQLESYNANASTAENQLALMETTLDSMMDSLFKINELTKKASNDTLSDSDRDAIAKEMEASLDDLIGLANTKDSNGDYIFSGFMSKVSPYSNDGNFVYQGDQGQRQMQVGTGSFVTTSIPGYAIFDDVMTGNGTFATTNGSSTNTGTGIISNGRLVDSTSYIADDYTISFVTNSSGELAYQVSGASQGQLIPAPPATAPADAPAYADGQSIILNGMEFSVTGSPAVGDDFGIEPSGRQNLFSSVQNIIDTVRMPINNDQDRALYHNNLERNAAALDNGISKVLSTITEVGASRSAVEKEKNINDDLITEHKTNLASIEDLDYTEAIIELNNQMTALQAAQASYMKIQSLSLLNYL